MTEKHSEILTVHKDYLELGRMLYQSAVYLYVDWSEIREDFNWNMKKTSCFKMMILLFFGGNKSFELVLEDFYSLFIFLNQRLSRLIYAAFNTLKFENCLYHLLLSQLLLHLSFLLDSFTLLESLLCRSINIPRNR